MHTQDSVGQRLSFPNLTTHQPAKTKTVITCVKLFSLLTFSMRSSLILQKTSLFILSKGRNKKLILDYMWNRESKALHSELCVCVFVCVCVCVCTWWASVMGMSTFVFDPVSIHSWRFRKIERSSRELLPHCGLGMTNCTDNLQHETHSAVSEKLRTLAFFFFVVFFII